MLDSVSAISASLTDRFALKVSLGFLFDNEPSFVEAPIQFPLGNALNILVRVPADELDTLFSTALVVHFRHFYRGRTRIGTDAETARQLGNGWWRRKGIGPSTYGLRVAVG